MSFMQPQVELGDFVEIENTHGESTVIPADVVIGGAGWSLLEYDTPTERPEILDAVRDFTEGEPRMVTLRKAWGARLSAPGYMDATDWTLHESEQAAREYLAEQYGDES